MGCRTVVSIGSDPDVYVIDNAPPTGTAHHVAIQIDRGDLELRFGRYGGATDESIVSTADRLMAALTEVRTHAVARINARREARVAAGETVCESPVCPIAGMTHFVTARGCSWRVYRPQASA